MGKCSGVFLCKNDPLDQYIPMCHMWVPLVAIVKDGSVSLFLFCIINDCISVIYTLPSFSSFNHLKITNSRTYFTVIVTPKQMTHFWCKNSELSFPEVNPHLMWIAMLIRLQYSGKLSLAVGLFLFFININEMWHVGFSVAVNEMCMKQNCFSECDR